MPSGWYSCNSYAISKDNTPQGFVKFVKFVFSKIKRQILPDSNNYELWKKETANLISPRRINETAKMMSVSE